MIQYYLIKELYNLVNEARLDTHMKLDIILIY
ncbi:hypothetical protein GGR27_004035 [Lewinella antarctica]|uniref:Uncharacterized protein n=1 Tax=Neolewinella antarctica TaxID=442734 RepID=A0ABX0XGQ4_9BACT|nr:hypothetical protein [Neolewinella antarctica]